MYSNILTTEIHRSLFHTNMGLYKNKKYVKKDIYKENIINTLYTSKPNKTTESSLPENRFLISSSNVEEAILNNVFSYVSTATSLLNSGEVCPNPRGYCSDTYSGIFKIFAAAALKKQHLHYDIYLY